MDSSNSNFGLDVGKIYFHYLIVWKTLFLIMIKLYDQMVYFNTMLDFTWRVSDCEEFVGVTQRSESHILKLNGAKVAQFEFV